MRNLDWDLIFDSQIDLMSGSHSASHQKQRTRVKRFSAFDNFFLRDIMDMFSGSEGGGLGPLLTPSRWTSSGEHNSSHNISRFAFANEKYDGYPIICWQDNALRSFCWQMEVPGPDLPCLQIPRREETIEEGGGQGDREGLRHVEQRDRSHLHQPALRTGSYRAQLWKKVTSGTINTNSALWKTTRYQVDMVFRSENNPFCGGVVSLCQGWERSWHLETYIPPSYP